MILNIALLIVLAISASVIAVIVFRKIPVLRTLDVATVPEAKTQQLRDRILLERIKRQSQKSGNFMKGTVSSLFGRILPAIKNLFKKIYDLEKKYKDQAFSKTDLSPAELNAKLKSLFDEANALMKSERYAEAEKFFIEIVSIDPKNIEAYEALAKVYALQKSAKEELEIRQFILKLRLKAGRTVTKENDKGEKVKTLDNAASVAESYFNVGAVYQKLDKFDQSLINYQRALEIEPMSPKFLDQAIEICVILKNRQLGYDFLKQLEVSNPDNQKLREYREKLKNL
jgi:tetratricopeptide (TPR) repeat protein